MSSPAGCGLFIYANAAARVARFYEAVAGLTRVHADESVVQLRAGALELLIHAIPAHIAAQYPVASPPQRREESALKFWFTVPSLAAARAAAAAHGGALFDDAWDDAGVTICNGCDPEGNVFQLRSAASRDA